VPAVALPAVRGAVRAVATDHVSVPAILANAAAVDVIDDHAIARLKPFAPRPHLHDLPARLMPGDGAGLVSLGSFSQVRAVDRADVAAADRARLGLDQHLPVAGLGHVELAELH